MPIYFGFPPRPRGTTKNSLETVGGEFEPAEISRVNITARPTVPYPFYSVFTSLFGHFVTSISYGPYSYLPVSSLGYEANSFVAVFPITIPNLSFCLKKGSKGLSDKSLETLELAGFATLNFAGAAYWTKERPTREDYLTVDELPGVQSTCVVPANHLCPDAFRAFLKTTSLVALSCCALSSIAIGAPMTPDSFPANHSAVNKMRTPEEIDDQGEEMVVSDADGEKTPPPMFVTPTIAPVSDPFAELLCNFVKGTVGSSPRNAQLAVGTFSGNIGPAFLDFTEIDQISSSGIFLKFEPKLAHPDTTPVGRFISRNLLSALSDVYDGQFAMLELLRSSMGTLRTSRSGAELAHLCTCMQLAMDSCAGGFPIFSGSFYEGYVIVGGPGGKLRVNGKTHGFMDSEALIRDIRVSSTHQAALLKIAGLLTPGQQDATASRITSMRALRAMCLLSRISQGDKDKIVLAAADLRFPSPSWGISPHTINRAFSLITGKEKPSDDTPLSPSALFSEDRVLVALSCFGETMVPSWNIPMGQFMSVKGDAPPRAPASAPKADKKGKQPQGMVNDCGWTMNIRKVKLGVAVEDFRRLSEQKGYRVVASRVAAASKYTVWKSGQMQQIWNLMKEAYTHISGDGKEDDGKKRAMEKEDVESEENPDVKGDVAVKKKMKI